jgi:hypothetical protein
VIIYVDDKVIVDKNGDVYGIMGMSQKSGRFFYRRQQPAFMSTTRFCDKIGEGIKAGFCIGVA